jgi:hypothetical protein
MGNQEASEKENLGAHMLHLLGTASVKVPNGGPEYLLIQGTYMQIKYSPPALGILLFLARISG